MTALTFRDFQNARQSALRAAPAVPYADPGAIFPAQFAAGQFGGSAGRNIAGREAANRIADAYELRTGKSYSEAA